MRPIREPRRCSIGTRSRPFTIRLRRVERSRWEAQRLGLEAHASDLNPVAVLINKAMIEIPPKFAGQAPVNPEFRQEKSLIEREWKGAQGLAEDVRYYGRWMREEAEKRIGHLYPKVEVSEEMVAERSDLERYKGPRADGDCLAVGAHGEEPQPPPLPMSRCRWRPPSCCQPKGQRSVRRAGDRGPGLSVHGEGG